ncbi:hypothetical protein MTBLM5_10091 [Magnetospirillum sp. LM-5]|nr:hypothetical protein MTBLM5_10091 [Magnetospirillum sp. LM-5]
MSSKSVEPVKPATTEAQPEVKAETAEQSRRRRAGIACFL